MGAHRGLWGRLHGGLSGQCGPRSTRSAVHFWQHASSSDEGQKNVEGQDGWDLESDLDLDDVQVFTGAYGDDFKEASPANAVDVGLDGVQVFARAHWDDF